MANPRPVMKSFVGLDYDILIQRLRVPMPTKQFEAACCGLAKDILTFREGFELVELGPRFRGTPFDLYGLRDSIPYIVEMKASRESFNSPGETQKRRMQEVLERVPGLGVALLQLKVCKGVYQIRYDEQLSALFQMQRAPIDPIVQWIESRIVTERSKR